MRTRNSPEGVGAQRPRAELAARELIARIAWLVRLRWLATAGVAVAITVAHFGFGIRLPLLPLYAIAACLAAYNAALRHATRSLRP